MPSECTITGTIYSVGQAGATASPAPNTRIRITPVSVAGIALSSKSFSITSDANGLVTFSAIQGSQINIEGPVIGFNTAGGATVQIPAQGNYAFESLVAITVTPATFGNPMVAIGDMIIGTTGGAAARLGIGSTGQILTVAGGIPSWATPTSGGTVSSVGLSLSLFTITNSPVTTTGTLTGTLTAQNPNIVLAGPTSGGAVPPTFRSLVAADIPDLSATYLIKANNLSDVNATTARGNLGLGSIATQAASAVAITGGTVAGLTGLALRSTGAGFDLTLASSEVLTAGRTLSFVLGDTARSLTIGASASVSGTNTGDQTTVSGNAGSATVLQTARAINGVSFDGSAPITVTAAAGTLTGTVLNATVVTSSLTSHGTITSGGLGTGAVIGGVTMTLGSDASGDVYYRNSSGVLTRVAAGAQNTIFTMGASSVPSWAAAAGGNPFDDGTAIIKGSGDATKLLRFEVDGFTTGTTRVITPPDSNTTLPIASQVITISGPTAARTWTAPDAAFSLARIDAAQTFVGTQAFAAMTATGTIVQTSASAAAFESGPNGSTNPVFRLVNSVASAATGLSVTGNAAAAGVSLNVLSSGTDEAMLLVPKGAGAVKVNANTGATVPFQVNVNGVMQFQVNSTIETDIAGQINVGGGFFVANASQVKIVSNTNPLQFGSTQDASLSRLAAKVLEIGDGGNNRNGWLADSGTARTSAQFDKTSNTTLADVTGLTISNLAAGRTYSFHAELFTSSNSGGGVQAAIAGTATATAIVYEATTMNGGALSAQTRATALGTSVGGVTAVTVAHITITGTITVNAGGTLTVQFAQNASNGTASSVLIGSYFWVKDTP